MIDKYNVNFSIETREEYKRRLINQLWKLIPMRENEENWRQHLQTIIEEISGLIRLYRIGKTGLTLLTKLEGLAVCGNFMVYRTTVFKCISLLGEILEDE